MGSGASGSGAPFVYRNDEGSGVVFSLAVEEVKIVASCPEGFCKEVMKICKLPGMSTAFGRKGDLVDKAEVCQVAVQMCKEFWRAQSVNIIGIKGGPHCNEEQSVILNLAMAIAGGIQTNLGREVFVSFQEMSMDHFRTLFKNVPRDARPQKVTVGLLSGESCRCTVTSFEFETVGHLKKEAEQKLGRKIRHLVLETNTLGEDLTLDDAGISKDARVTAVCIADTPFGSDSPISHLPEDEQKEFEQSGITLRMPQGIYDEFHPQVKLLEDWQDLKGILSLQDVLPAGHTVLSPLLRLTPEDVTFPAPIEVKMPVCVGASTAWRSTSNGWEKVEVNFGDGFATIALTHFCDSFVSGARSPIMALGFIKQDEPAAKVAVTHAGCLSCAAMLEEYRKEGLSLGAFSCCGSAAELGAYKDDEVLDVQVADGPPSQIKLRFERLPRISRKWTIQSADSFNAEINDELFDFLLPPSHARMLRSAGRASPASAAVVPPMATSSSRPPVPAAQARRRVQFVPSSPASGGAAGSGSPEPAAVQATPQTGPEWHVLLSGRFKSDDFFSSEQIKDYMRAVKRQLEARSIPAFMVEARLSQSFAELTRFGLGRAKCMVAFCTSEYGAYTGVGYETFCELEFAYDKKLPIFPIKLCEDWPPAPRGNDKGIWQNKLVFTNGRLYIEDKQMQDAEGIADKIADDVEQLGLFSSGKMVGTTH